VGKRIVGDGLKIIKFLRSRADMQVWKGLKRSVLAVKGN